MNFSLIAAGVAALAMAPAAAQQRAVSSGARVTYPSQSNLFAWERGSGFHGRLGGGVWIVEREVPVIVEREVAVEKETPPPPAAVPLPQKAGGGDEARKPYVIGASYASLPGSCMKLIEEGASYYFCGGGEWYQEVRAGRDPLYRAVARKL